MKSKDQTQSLKKKKNTKKTHDEEECKSFELLLCSLPGLDWVMLAHTHVAHRSGTHGQKETQLGALSYLNPPKQGFDLVEALRLLSAGTCSWSFF